MSANEYEPQYIDGFDGIPVMGYDEWDTPEKREKVERAETKLERDVNGGNTIETSTDDHADAVEEWASYLLAAGIVDPNSAKGGDLADDGSRRASYAGQMKSMYQDTIEMINMVDEDEDSRPDPEFTVF